MSTTESPVPAEPPTPATPLTGGQRRLLAIVTTALAAAVIIAVPNTLDNARTAVRIIVICALLAAFALLGLASTRLEAQAARLVPIGLSTLAAAFAVAWLMPPAISTPAGPNGLMIVVDDGGREICGDVKGVDSGFLLVTVTEPAKVNGRVTTFTPYDRDFLLQADRVVSMRQADECEKPYD